MSRKPRFVATRVGHDAPVDPKTIYRIRIDLAPDENAQALRAFRLDYCCMPFERDPKGGRMRLHSYANGATAAAMRKAGRTVEVMGDAVAETKHLHKLFSKADRFQGGLRGPELIGTLI